MVEITYVYYSKLDPKAAHANQIVHTCNALVKRGHEVTVVCAGDIDAYLREHDLERKFNIVEFALSGERSMVDRLWYYAGAVYTARGADILFTRDISFLRVLCRIPTLLYPPVVYEAHKSYAGTGEISASEEQRRLAAANVVITISPGVEADLTEMGVDVSAVVPDAADLSLVPPESKFELRSSLGMPESARVAIYSGSLADWKNDIRGLVSNVGELAEYDEIRLYMLGGEQDEVAALREYRDERGIDVETVQFTGHVSQPTVFRYLKAGDVGVIPLRETDPVASRYTSPLKLYEYLISGLRIVASDVPAIWGAMGDEPVIHTYPPDEPERMRAALEDAFEAGQPPAYDRTKYSYSGRVETLERVFESA